MYRPSLEAVSFAERVHEAAGVVTHASFRVSRELTTRDIIRISTERSQALLQRIFDNFVASTGPTKDIERLIMSGILLLLFSFLTIYACGTSSIIRRSLCAFSVTVSYSLAISASFGKASAPVFGLALMLSITDIFSLLQIVLRSVQCEIITPAKDLVDQSFRHPYFFYVLSVAAVIATDLLNLSWLWVPTALVTVRVFFAAVLFVFRSIEMLVLGMKGVTDYTLFAMVPTAVLVVALDWAVRLVSMVNPSFNFHDIFDVIALLFSQSKSSEVAIAMFLSFSILLDAARRRSESPKVDTAMSVVVELLHDEDEVVKPSRHESCCSSAPDSSPKKPINTTVENRGCDGKQFSSTNDAPDSSVVTATSASAATVGLETPQTDTAGSPFLAVSSPIGRRASKQSASKDKDVACDRFMRKVLRSGAKQSSTVCAEESSSAGVEEEDHHQAKNINKTPLKVEDFIERSRSIKKAIISHSPRQTRRNIHFVEDDRSASVSAVPVAASSSAMMTRSRATTTGSKKRRPALEIYTPMGKLLPDNSEDA